MIHAPSTTTISAISAMFTLTERTTSTRSRCGEIIFLEEFGHLVLE